MAQNTGTYNFSYGQGFQSGTNMSVGFTNSRITTNNVFNIDSPQISPAFQFRLTQHLLQGFGFLPNTRLIRLTKNNREISDVAFRLQIITTVDQIENMYWDLVFAYENVRVQQESLAFAQKTLSDNQKQVQIGSLAPIEVVRAQSTVAVDQQQLIQAQNQPPVAAIADEERSQPDVSGSPYSPMPTSFQPRPSRLPEQEPLRRSRTWSTTRSVIGLNWLSLGSI